MQSFQVVGNKIILRIQSRICESDEEIFQSELFQAIVEAAIKKLSLRRSILLNVFGDLPVMPADIKTFIETLRFLLKMPAHLVPNVVPGAEKLLKDPAQFNELVEYLYNFWRSFDRFMIADAQDAHDWDKKPYRTFNDTIWQLTNLIRSMYRDIQENTTGKHPRIYRQVAAGAEVATIAVQKNVPLPAEYKALAGVPMIRQMLIYPPLILTPSMNKRSGRFEPVAENPLKGLAFDPQDWLCYPAKVGTLVILIYFHNHFAELGHALCNLFQLAEEEDLTRQPDAVYAYGVSPEALKGLPCQTVFFDDVKNGIFSAAVPGANEFGYFGYLKKMVLTLHNVIMMKRGILPFHGALIRMILKGGIDRTILFMGDTGAGKSETLEAFRSLGEEHIQDMIIVADDMGSLQITPDGKLMGYGTEIGAFLRLDDLQPGYALGQIDRAIIMSANQVNARIILPVTTYEEVVKGEKVDFILYANNYDMIDEEQPIIQRFTDTDKALAVFREGTAMSKGTTTSTGLVHSYFANVFGPAQFKDLHEPLAQKYFEQCFKSGVYVGQVRTRLGLNGWERKGPEEAARELLEVIRSSK